MLGKGLVQSEAFPQFSAGMQERPQPIRGLLAIRCRELYRLPGMTLSFKNEDDDMDEKWPHLTVEKIKVRFQILHFVLKLNTM